MISETLRVSYTPDGDTLRLFRNHENSVSEVRVRLAYIDAPEMSQGIWGTRARAYLRTLLYVNEPVNVIIYGTDDYQRIIAEVIRWRGYANCGLRLVQGGYAALREAPEGRPEYQAAQTEAQTRKRGIWSVPGLQQTPWTYRAQQGTQ